MTDMIKAQREQLARIALDNSDLLDELFTRLESSSRRERQNAAATLSAVASFDPQAVFSRIDAFVNALDRPEAQTRWESLEVLIHFLSLDPDSCDKALPGAESALFDEDSGPLRLAALRFLCKYGELSQKHSLQVWPLLDEAIQCYHGDLEFQDMLIAVISFSESDLADSVRDELKDRMEFDAKHGRGVLKKRAQLIIENLDK
ncbi:hypothetical protein [Slackia sp.]|uniref:hypothetical protein n=1 Tax=Slackia sp. TaxID=2049041 RepID=UPI003A96DDFC